MSREITAILTRYRDWLHTIDDVFDRARRMHPDAVPCHAGCSHCCCALFAVPVIDGFLLWEGFRCRGPEVARNALKRCQLFWDTFTAETGVDTALPFRVETVGWREFDILVDGFARPCPFLTDSGECGIYDWRPRICRLAGTVFADPVTGTEIPDFCPLAEDARAATGFQPAPFDISGMDARMHDFREEFAGAVAAVRHRNETAEHDGLHTVSMHDGHTFPAAGVLEAAAFYSANEMV